MQIWKAGNAVRQAMTDLIAEHHPHLADTIKEIAVIFREKASKSGGVIVAGKAKKAPKLMEVLGEAEYKFIIELAADEWQSYNDTQRKALLDHCLCACKVDIDKSSGQLVYGLRNPEFSFFKEEIQRWGIWQNVSLDDDEAQEAATTLEELLLKEPVPSGVAEEAAG